MNNQRIMKAFALLLVFVVLPTYTQANLLAAKTSSDVVENAGAVPAAKLITRGNQPIDVNGNSAATGLTVFSGAHLRTPVDVDATVQFDAVTRVEVATDTELTIAFTNDRIDVTLLRGNAVVTAREGVTGTVTTPDGEVKKTDPAKTSSVSGQNDDRRGGAGQGGNGAGGQGGQGGASPGGGPSFGRVMAFGLPIMAGATTAAIVVPCRRGRNPSPGTPRGRNEECRRGF